MNSIKSDDATKDTVDLSNGRQVSCRITNSLLKYVVSMGYDTDSLVAGLLYSKEHLSDPLNWVPYVIKEELTDRAARLLHDERIMYQVGLSTPKLDSINGIEHIVRLLGNPVFLYQNWPRYVRLFDRCNRIETHIIDKGNATVTLSVASGYVNSKHVCNYVQGLLTAVPVLWGLPQAEVTELQCIHNTDRANGQEKGIVDKCVFKVSWQPLPSLRKRLGKRFFNRRNGSSNLQKIEENFRLLDMKNAELTRRNTQLAKVREIALAVNTVRTQEQVYSTIVEGARDIQGVHFVILLKTDESGKYVTAPYYSRIRNDTLTTAFKTIGFDFAASMGESPSSEKFKFPISQSVVAREFIKNPRVIVNTSLSYLMEGIWNKSMCDAIQKVAGFNRIVVVPLTVEEEQWGSILFHLNDEVPQDILEMVAAHCVTAIKNVNHMNTLEKHNGEKEKANQELAKAKDNLESVLKSLTASEHKYRLIADNTVDYISLLDSTGAYSYTSPSHKRLGYEDGDLLGKSLLEIVHPDDTARLALILDKYSRMKPDEISDPEVEAVHRLNYRLADRWGGWHDFEASTNLVVAPDDNSNNLLLTSRDITERKQSEQAIKDSEEKYRMVFESANDIILLLDGKGKIVDVNDKLYEIGGWDREELVGKNIMSLTNIISKKSLPIIIANFLKRIAGMKIEPYQVEMVKRNGELTTIEINARAVRKDGKVIGDLAILRDITERKRIEKTLKESEERYSNLIHSTHEIIQSISPDGKFQFVNKAWHAILGYSEEDLKQLTLFDIIHPDSLEHCQQVFQEVVSGSSVSGIEAIFKARDGSVVYVEGDVIPRYLEGKLIATQGFFRDVTNRTKAEAKLHAQKELIDRILSTTPDSVLVVGKDSKIALVNRTFCETFNKKNTEVETKLLSDVLPIDALCQAFADIKGSNIPGTTVEFRYAIIGHEMVFVSSILKMQDEEILVIISDVTEEREKQERLYLTDRLASVGEMAAGIAHELNNPLTGVIGLSQLLVDEEVPDNVKEDLKSIYGEAQRAAKVVKNLLMFARKHDAVREKTHVNRVLGDVLNLRAYEHRVNNIRVNGRLDSELPEIMADYFQIQQVFLNLILNAEQAMIAAHNGGTLTVTTERVDGDIRIQIADDGPGISPEHMRKLFTPFFTTKEVGKGTGLGLSICYGIVTSHGGKIYARSNPDQGVTFIVELPIGTQEATVEK